MGNKNEAKKVWVHEGMKWQKGVLQKVCSKQSTVLTKNGSKQYLNSRIFNQKYDGRRIKSTGSEVIKKYCRIPRVKCPHVQVRASLYQGSGRLGDFLWELQKN